MVVDDEDVAHALQQQQHEARPRPHNSGGVSPEHHASGKGGKTKNDYQKKYRSSDKGPYSCVPCAGRCTVARFKT
jgi:hypothetical protein